LAAGLPPGAQLVSDSIDEHTQLQRTNGVPFLRLVPTIEDSADHRRIATLAYVVSSATGIYCLSFASDAAHAADVAKVADNAMSTLVAGPPDPPRSVNVFNVLFYWLGRLVAWGLLAMVGYWFVMWIRARQRKVV
jgi:hypothetical protein